MAFSNQDKRQVGGYAGHQAGDFIALGPSSREEPQTTQRMYGTAPKQSAWSQGQHYRGKKSTIQPSAGAWLTESGELTNHYCSVTFAGSRYLWWLHLIVSLIGMGAAEGISKMHFRVCLGGPWERTLGALWAPSSEVLLPALRPVSHELGVMAPPWPSTMMLLLRTGSISEIMSQDELFRL